MKSFTIRTVLRGLMGSALLVVMGCGPTNSVNPWALRKENDQLKTAIRQYQDQLAHAKIDARQLDEDNEALQSRLAQQQQATQRAQSPQNKLALSNTPRPPIERSSEDYNDDKEFTPRGGRPGSGPGKAVATARKGGSSGWLPMANLQGAEVIRDGDTVRIRVTNTSLFDPGKATLKPGATQVLDRVASTVRRDYAGQLIGIEGHTDADPIKKSNWKDNHELSVQRAMAVYEYLRTKGGVASDQLYVAGYGPNVPVASNKSAGGKAQNRRVEFVVHPTGARAANDGSRR